MTHNDIRGIKAIDAVFARLRGEKRAAFMPYCSLGYPTMEGSARIVEECCREGSDLMELGIPFSDPLADGPTIQMSTHIALERGATTWKCLETVRRLRDSGIKAPFLLMGYINPILSYDMEKFVRDAAAAGADGFIVPDLPLEESAEFESLSARTGLAFIHLVPPTAPDERIAAIAARSSGYLYLVSLIGVTGARKSVSSDLESFIARVRAKTELPLAVGFGISTPEQAITVARKAEGVIVGSALIDAIADAEKGGRDSAMAAGLFVREFIQAMA